MRRARRMAAIGGGVIAVGALALVLRTLSTAGVFSDVTPGFTGTCQPVMGAGPGVDIAVDRKLGLAFIASADRRANDAGQSDVGQSDPGQRDGLYVVTLAHPGLGAIRLSGVPADFHPRGIDLYRETDGTLTLMAVNLRKKGPPSVDIFDLTDGFANDGTPRVILRLRASVRSVLFFAPQDVAAVGPDRFYLTNARPRGMDFEDILKSYLSAPDADVVYYDGHAPRIVAEGLRDADGIAASRDGTRLYVTQTLDRAIRTYNVQPASGTLIFAEAYALPAGLARIDVDATGDLWVAGHPDLFAYARFAADATKPSPSEIFKVSVENGLPQTARPVYAGLGRRIGAASVGVEADGRLLIGSALDGKLLECTPY